MKQIKRICCLLLTAVILLCAVPVNAATIIGSVLTTDIKAYINGVEIPSYNIDGNMVIVGSDLRSYGFNVVYNDSVRTSYVSYDGSGTWNPIAPSTDSYQSIGTKVMDVYKSDITVCINGNYVNCYNVGGKMAFRFAELKIFGNYYYDNSSRTSNLWLNTNTSSTTNQNNVNSNYGSNNHVHNEVIKSGYLATCTEDGLSEGTYCSICGEVIVEQRTIQATGHRHTKLINQKDATEYRKGYTGDLYCTDCGDIVEEGEVIAKLEHEHDMEKIKGKDATCTKSGYITYYVCSGCDGLFEKVKGDYVEIDEDDIVIPTTGHNYSSEYTIDTVATCTQDGSKSRHCLDCGAKTDVTSIKGEHKFSDWSVKTEPTCTSSGTNVRYCTVCGKEEYSEVAALNHTGGTATCNEKAICNRCGSEYGDINPNKHKYTSTYDKANSTVSYTCEHCGNSYSETVSPLSVSASITSTSSLILNSYKQIVYGYKVTATGGYGAYKYKAELYRYETSTSPFQSLDYSSENSFSITYTGTAYYAKFTVQDEAGNEESTMVRISG